jgi:hypothetical protein
VATTFLPPIYALLRAAPEVTALVGTKIYAHGRAPQGAVPPYVVWSVVGGDPENTLSETPDLDRLALQVDCYHTADQGVDALARAVRDALEPRAHMTGIVVNEREVETTYYRIGLQFDFWHSR